MSYYQLVNGNPQLESDDKYCIVSKEQFEEDMLKNNNIIESWSFKNSVYIVKFRFTEQRVALLFKSLTNGTINSQTDKRIRISEFDLDTSLRYFFIAGYNAHDTRLYFCSLNGTEEYIKGANSSSYWFDWNEIVKTYQNKGNNWIYKTSKCGPCAIVGASLENISFIHYSIIAYSQYQRPRNAIIPVKSTGKALQQIYYGAPGTGKSFTIDNLTNDDNSIRTTFHPDTDYASFVGAYKPTMKDMPLSAFVGKEVHRAQPQGEHPGTEQRIVYKYVPQAFLKAYVAAWSKLDTPYYLIIEEINRGNCAQIFGDLFQLLDRNNSGSSSYAINADEDITKFLKEDVNGFASLSQEQRDAIAAYELVKDNGEKRAIGEKILDGTLLLLPHNLHIWATMNTSDQSLFPIDSAFKRRWNWKYVPIDTNPIDKRTQKPLDWKIDVAGFLYSWGKFLEKINPEIYSLTESSDKQMGYFFVKADPSTGYISEEVFLNKVLFYLWTDVFKDYDVSSEIFKNKKENRSFRFTDFFEDAEALANFIDNCGLDIVDINIDSIVDEDETTESSSSKDYTRYSINDNGKYSKRQLVLQSLRSYVEANHSMTSAEIIEKWETVNPNIQHFILSESQYENRIKEAPSSLERYFPVELDSGEKIYITNQWNKVTISEFIKLINKSDFGFQIKEVNK